WDVQLEPQATPCAGRAGTSAFCSGRLLQLTTLQSTKTYPPALKGLTSVRTAIPKPRFNSLLPRACGATTTWLSARDASLDPSPVLLAKRTRYSPFHARRTYLSQRTGHSTLGYGLPTLGLVVGRILWNQVRSEKGSEKGSANIQQKQPQANTLLVTHVPSTDAQTLFPRAKLKTSGKSIESRGVQAANDVRRLLSPLDPTSLGIFPRAFPLARALPATLDAQHICMLVKEVEVDGTMVIDHTTSISQMG
ncbi:MAG: hypothetical protein Q9193_006705, partial [Seirophora villosa]